MSKSNRFEAKIFLEGVEVPYNSAHITSSLNSGTMASINLIPHHTARQIKPKTLVNIAVREPQIKSANIGDQWLSAFEGEYFARGSIKTPTSRSFSITATDYTNYWDSALLYFADMQQIMASGSDMNVIKTQQEILVGKEAKFQPVVTGIASILKTYVGQGKGSIQGAIKLMIESTNKINKFYENAEKRLRITDRIVYQGAGNEKALLNTGEFLQFVTGLTSELGGFTPLREAVLTWAHTLFHNMINIPFPSVVDNKPHQFLYIPDTYMLPPPMCNVIFPSQYTTTNFNRNYQQEPTRMVFVPEGAQIDRNPSAAQMYTKNVFTPDSFSHYMSGTGTFGPGPFDMCAESANAYGGERTDKTISTKTREPDYLTNEEAMQGISYARSGIPTGMTRLMLAGQKSQDKLFRQIGDFLFYKQRYAARQTSIPCKFLPSIVPGLPVLVLDDSPDRQNLLGVCTSVDHYISHDSASTTVTLMYVRELDETQFSSGGKTMVMEPPIPPWYNSNVFGKEDATGNAAAVSQVTKDPELKSYLNNYVGANNFSNMSTYYQALLGVDAITNTNIPYLLPAAYRLLEEYKKNRDQGTDALDIFIYNKTFRKNMLTLAGSFSFIGASATKEGNQFLDNGKRAFSGASTLHKEVVKARLDAILAYATALKESRGHRG